MATSRDRDLLTFEWLTARLALPYSSLSYAILETRGKRHQSQVEELTLVFSSHVVTLWGERLSQVQEAISDRTAVVVRPAPPSASMLEHESPVVTELKWVEVKPDTDEGEDTADA